MEDYVNILNRQPKGEFASPDFSRVDWNELRRQSHELNRKFREEVHMKNAKRKSL